VATEAPPSNLKDRLKNVSDWSVEVVKSLVTNPGDARHVGNWFRTMSRSSLDLGLPWWPYSVIEIVEEYLTPSSRVFEYGSGGSTLWLESRVGYLRSVEHDQAWFSQVCERVDSECVVLEMPTAIGRVASEVDQEFFDSYVSSINMESDVSLDLVIVDGRCRMACVEIARSKLRPGGLLLLDDSDRARYQGAAQLLSGWECCKYRGLKTGGAGHATIWTAPKQG
jgi:hypothetical protein